MKRCEDCKGTGSVWKEVERWVPRGYVKVCKQVKVKEKCLSCDGTGHLSKIRFPRG